MLVCLFVCFWLIFCTSLFKLVCIWFLKRFFKTFNKFCKFSSHVTLSPTLVSLFVNSCLMCSPVLCTMLWKVISFCLDSFFLKSHPYYSSVCSCLSPSTKRLLLHIMVLKSYTREKFHSVMLNTWLIVLLTSSTTSVVFEFIIFYLYAQSE